MKTWLREVLDESTKNVSKWPEWRKQPEHLDEAANSNRINGDLDLVETSIAMQVQTYARQKHL
ncbi:MAG: hypothetical protein ACYCO5_00395 [Acidobacteriaceae bacterium]